MNAEAALILIVDDDESLRKVLSFQLRDAGHRVETSNDVAAARAVLEHRPVDLLLTDLKMPGESGLDLLAHARERQPDLPVIVMTAYGTIDDAVTAMKRGAFDFITKPVNREHLKALVSRALEHGSLQRRVARLEEEVSEKYGREGIISVSPQMETALRLAERVAATESTVLISGESGTGKELFARLIHFRSPRRDRPLIAVNCAAIPRDLLESELFGHRRGAFTGASKDKTGKFVQAHRGTLFLDEIGELPLELQAKLLRALESGQIDVLGGESPAQVDVRIVAATNRDLGALVAEKLFREDLFFRINVINLHLPALRERPQDIPLLARSFIRAAAGERELTIADDVLVRLSRLPWPGNVRELRNVCERLVLLRHGDTITVADLELATLAAGPVARRVSAQVVELPPAGYPLEEIEREAIRQALAHANGNQSEAARLLDIPRHILLYRLKKFGMG
jgi:two-component system NtrC family response regulator